MPKPEPGTVQARAKTLLLESGDRLGEATLQRARVAIDSDPEDWSLSGHKVLAYRAQLLVPHDILIRLQQHPDLRERIRSSLRTAFDTRDRVLRDVSVVLDPATLGADRDDESLEDHPYRMTTPHATRPSPAVLRSAAERYAALSGDADCAALLSRAQLQCEPAAPLSRDSRACYRVHVLVGLDDLALAARTSKLRERVADVVRAVGTTPALGIGDVSLSPMIAGVVETARTTGAERHAASVLQDLLAAEGIVSVVIGTVERGTRLVVHHEGETAIVDLVEGEGLREVGPSSQRLEVGLASPDPAGTARRIRAMLVRGRGCGQ